MIYIKTILYKNGNKCYIYYSKESLRIIGLETNITYLSAQTHIGYLFSLKHLHVC